MLIERDIPLAQLQELVRQTASGRGATVLVLGEAGIGKSSLLRQFLASLGPDAMVLTGGCEDLFTPRALGPFRDMAPAMGPDIVALLDEVSEPARIFSRLLARLGEMRSPVVMLVEDVHWADQATLDLLKYLARRSTDRGIVLVASVRTDELPPPHPFWSWVGDLPSASTHRIALQPLSPHAVAELAQGSGRDAEALFRITAGNPFFISELLSAHNDNHADLPLSIRDAIWTRVSRMSAKERELLQLVSISPVPIEDWLLEGVLGTPASIVADSCIERGLLLRCAGGQLSFRHELARQAVLERVAPSALTALHAQFCTVLTQGRPGHVSVALARLVYHAAGANMAALVLELAPRAAHEAARLGAHKQAAAHLACALRYVTSSSSPAVTAQLSEDWAYEAGLSKIDEDVIAARKQAIASWRRLDRNDKVGFNLRWLSRMYWYCGEAELAERFGMEAIQTLEQLPNSKELAMAYSLRSQHLMLQDHPQEAIAWGQRAMALAEELDDRDTTVHSLNNVGTAMLFSGQAGGLAFLEQSLHLALQHDYHEHAARAFTNLAEHAVVFKEFARAEALLAAGIAFDSEHDLDAWTYYLVGWQAQLRLEQGRLREAETIARSVLALDDLTLVMRLPALTVLGRALSRLGEADGQRYLAEALQASVATGEVQRIVPVQLGLAEAAWLAGDDSVCQTWLQALVRHDLSGLNAWDRGAIVVWCQRAGLPHADAVPTDLPTPWACELGGDCHGASAAWAELGLPFEAALALLCVDDGRAGEAAVRAVGLFEATGARQAALRARKLAKQLGQRDQLPKTRRGPYGAARQHPSGLTGREAQVLDLLRAGLSNADIARQLSRSPRTVEHHVSALLDKLGAASRLELLTRANGVAVPSGTKNK